VIQQDGVPNNNQISANNLPARQRTVITSSPPAQQARITKKRTQRPTGLEQLEGNAQYDAASSNTNNLANQYQK